MNNKWISVAERLPDSPCEVLTYTIHGAMIVMSFHANSDSGNRYFHAFNFCDWRNQHDKVTHWMPLPEPPKSNRL